MTRFGWSVYAGMAALLVIIVGLFLWHHSRSSISIQVPKVQPTQPAANVTDPSQLAIYTSGEYGFTFFYPSTAQVFDAYSATSTAGYPWRASAIASGTPIVRIRTSMGDLQVGLSNARNEIKNCLSAGASETTLPKSTVGSTTWSSFSFQKIGTDDQESITSYRTLHDGACYTLETFEPIGKTATSTEPISLSAIVQSFTFVSP